MVNNNGQCDCKKSVVIEQRTKKGTLIERFSSVSVASRDTGVPFNEIMLCLAGIQAYAGGCQWVKRSQSDIPVTT